MSRPGLGDELAAYPVAIIGAGPVGLAAAAHLAEKGIDFVVLEAGPAAGASVTAWGHVRLFSPWEFLVDAAAGRLLDAAGWDSPQATRIPYGRDLVADYLLPLAATPEIAPRVRYNSAVTASPGAVWTAPARRAAAAPRSCCGLRRRRHPPSFWPGP
jgi:cation diffusion facilitator CzcD-associated flavoprotein CzcO